VRSNRLLGCQLPNNKKSERGTIYEIVSGEGDVVVTQWSDNRTVLLASNFVGKGTVDQVRRWSKVEKDYVHVSRPEVIRLYNSSMGGVDKMDFLLQLYRIFICSRKWPLRVIFHFMSVAVNNSWLDLSISVMLMHLALPRRSDLTYTVVLSALVKLCARQGLVSEQTREVNHPALNSDHQRNRSAIWDRFQMLGTTVLLTGLRLATFSNGARMTVVVCDPNFTIQNAKCIYA